MTGINLLTQELKPNTHVSEFSRNLKKMVVISSIIFLVSGVVLLVSILILSSRINSSEAQQQKLKSQIASLEKTEQKLILVKDRLSKINRVLASDSAYGEVVVLENITKIIPPEVVIKDAKLEKGSLEVTLISKDLSPLTGFLSSVKNLGVRSIKQNSFEFVSDIGYQLKLTILK